MDRGIQINRRSRIRCVRLSCLPVTQSGKLELLSLSRFLAKYECIFVLRGNSKKVEYHHLDCRLESVSFCYHI